MPCGRPGSVRADLERRGPPGSRAALAFFEKGPADPGRALLRCHGPDSGKGKAKLRVDSLEALLRGGESGPAIVPRRAGAEPARCSRSATTAPWRCRRRRSSRRPRSTPRRLGEDGGPVALRRPALPTRRPAPIGGTIPRWPECGARSSGRSGAGDVAVPPGVADAGWPRSPIDRFILARLEAAGLRPAPPADRRTLIRRATLDLIGPAADAGGGRGVRARRLCRRRLRPRRRPAARLAAIRRAVGPALARRRPLRRQQRHGRQPRLLRRLALSRLRHRAPSTPTSRSTAIPRGADRRRPARRHPTRSGATSGSSRPASWRSARRCSPRTTRSSSRWTSSTSSSTRRAASSSA